MRKLLICAALAALLAACTVNPTFLPHSEEVPPSAPLLRTAASPPAPLFSDDFESGGTTLWDAEFPNRDLFTIPGRTQAIMDWRLLCPHGPGMYVMQATITNRDGAYTVATNVHFTTAKCLQCCPAEQCQEQWPPEGS